MNKIQSIIDVSGFEFIPIHDFVPNVQKNDFGIEGPGPGGYATHTQGSLRKFGDERYISLSDGSNNNYTKDGSSIPN